MDVFDDPDILQRIRRCLLAFGLTEESAADPRVFRLAEQLLMPSSSPGSCLRSFLPPFVDVCVPARVYPPPCSGIFENIVSYIDGIKSGSLVQATRKWGEALRTFPLSFPKEVSERQLYAAAMFHSAGLRALHTSLFSIALVGCVVFDKLKYVRVSCTEPLESKIMSPMLALYMFHKCERINLSLASMNLEWILTLVSAAKHNKLELSLDDQYLRTLSFQSMPLGNEGLAELAKFIPLVAAKLKKFIYRANRLSGKGGGDALSHLISDLPHLEYLDVSGNLLGDDGVAQLANTLSRHPSLTTLVMSNNNIGAKGMYYLSRALSKNPVLRSLQIAVNSVGDTSLSSLRDALLRNTNLKILQLSGNKIDNRGVETLCQVISETCRITSLNLFDNEISDEGATELGKMLADGKCSVVNLCLSKNAIGNEGIINFSSKLMFNKSLANLVIGANTFDVKGAAALSDALAKHPALRTLSVSVMPNLGDEGAEELSRILRYSHVLRFLSLMDINMEKRGASAILSAIQSNPRSSLRILSMRENIVPQYIVEKLMELVPVVEVT